MDEFVASEVKRQVTQKLTEVEEERKFDDNLRKTQTKDLEETALETF